MVIWLTTIGKINLLALKRLNSCTRWMFGEFIFLYLWLSGRCPKSLLAALCITNWRSSPLSQACQFSSF